MKRWKAFGARRSIESAASRIASPQCLPGLYSPGREAASRRRSVDGSRFAEVKVSGDGEFASNRRRSVDGSRCAEVKVSDDGELASARYIARRRSVDESQFPESADLEAVRREINWKAPGDGELASAWYIARRRSVDDSQLRESEDLEAVRREINWKARAVGWRTAAHHASTSSSDSFSSSSSRPSDASVLSDTMLHAAGDGGVRATVLGFDASAREAGVTAAVLWTFRNVLRKGDVLVMVGVMEYIRGPLGYKVQVNDQTWLGANKKALREEIRARNAAWQGLPGLKKLCEDAGVRLVVDVKAAARAEVVIVQEAVAVGAGHVVLDKSLHNRRRRYYLERLSCDVTRMRRSGGVDSIRSLAGIASDREKGRMMSSPTSVLTPQRPPRSAVAPSSSSAPYPTDLLESAHDSSFNSSLSRLVKLVEEKHVVATDEVDDLFSIDHAFMARRVNMLLEPEPDLADYRRDQLAMADDQGYESDDLFSLAGDGASRRPSIAVFCPPDLHSQSARSSIAARSSHDFSRLSLDSGPRLDKRLLPS